MKIVSTALNIIFMQNSSAELPSLLQSLSLRNSLNKIHGTHYVSLSSKRCTESITSTK